jgi:hypothetical protein
MENPGHELPVPKAETLANILHRGEVGALIREAIAKLIETGDLPSTRTFSREEGPWTLASKGRPRAR